MTKKRTIGTMAALGGMTAAIALLSGLPSAKADELSDLRANQELLQRRLDQLAQAPGPGNPYGLGGPAGPAAVQMMGGSFPRSFLIPGTDTSIRVGGVIREKLMYWFTGGAPNSSPQSGNSGDNGQLPAIPLQVKTGAAPTFTPAGNAARSRGNAIFHQTPLESNLSIETRTPTAYGEARTYIEFDFNSNGFVPGGATPTSVSDNLGFRLRFAYGTLGGFLFGQANSNFSDPDANSETLDFGGNMGDPGVVRIPQVRYTMPLAAWGLPGAFSISAETPETDAWTAAGIMGSDLGASAITAVPALACPVVGATATCAIPGNIVASNPTKSVAPDLTMAWFIPQPWGHMDFSAVVRPGLQFKDGTFLDRNFVGWGVHFGGDVKPGWFGWNQDTITFHFTYGDAIGRYLNSSANFALVSNYGTAATTAPGTAGSATNIIVKPTVEWGGGVGYRHNWLPNLRSTLSMGINHHDINTLRGFVCARGSAGAATGAGGCGLNKELISAHANLIWNPVPAVDVGIEYMYGHRQVVSNLKGDENVLISRFALRF